MPSPLLTTALVDERNDIDLMRQRFDAMCCCSKQQAQHGISRSFPSCEQRRCPIVWRPINTGRTGQYLNVKSLNGLIKNL